MKFKKTLAASAVLIVMVFFAALLPVSAEPAQIKTYLPIVGKPEGFKNPGFEQGQTGWVFNSNFPGETGVVTNSRAHSGQYSARLGHDNDSLHGPKTSISQQVTVPYGDYLLTYYHYVISTEGQCPPSWQESFDSIIIYVNGQRHRAYNLCSDPMINNDWVKKTIYMGDYRGLTIDLEIAYVGSWDLPSDIYVDDFAFE